MFDEHKPGSSPSLAGAGQLMVARSETQCGEMAFIHYAAHYLSQGPMEITSCHVTLIAYFSFYVSSISVKCKCKSDC